MTTARGACLLRQLVAETRALRDALSPHLESADDFALSLASLLVVSRCEISADEAVSLVADYADKSLSSIERDRLLVAAQGLGDRLRSVAWDELFDPIQMQMGAAGPYVIESFFAAYDRGRRRSRGIYFTPQPIVRFLVRAADEIVRHHLHLDAGLSALASNERPLRMVDPACGTGVFLGEALEVARRDGWTQADLRCAAARCLGFEIINPNIVVAHWHLRQRVGQLAASSDFRPRLIKDTALSAQSETVLHGHGDSNKTGSQSGDQPLLVLGNPPYANFGRLNRDPWILNLLATYSERLDERKHNLADDYIKFFRWAEHHIELAGSGVLAFITNHAYLTAITHRQMRRRLQTSFDQIYVLDLGGRIGRHAADENVFGIRSGVAIALMARTPARQKQNQTMTDRAVIRHAALSGTRREKLNTLQTCSLKDIQWTQIHPLPAMFWFAPNRQAEEPDEYRTAPALNEVFEHFISGVQSKNDELFVDMDRQALERRMCAYFAEQGIRDSQVSYRPAYIRPYLVAPFDQRWIYYDPRLLGRARYGVMRHMLHDNRGLVFMRQSTNDGAYDHFLITHHLVSDRVFYSGHGAPFLAPLWLYENGSRRMNFRREFTERLKQIIGVEISSARAMEVLAYIYGVVMDSVYRQRWDAWLKIGFPRIPWPNDSSQFKSIALRGRELMQLHLSATQRDESGTQDDDWLIAAGYPQFEIATGSDVGKVWISGRVGIDNVFRSAWELRIGGYPVLARWLKQRRGRHLSHGDRAYLRSLIDVLRRT